MVRPKIVKNSSRGPKKNSRPTASDERRWARKKETLDKYAKLRQQESRIL
jgi:hypothetical protein